MRGQASIETILAFAVLLLVFAFVTTHNSFVGGSAKLLEEKFDEQKECLKLASLISMVYAEGPGTVISFELGRDANVFGEQRIVRIGEQQCGFLAIAQGYALSPGTISMYNVGGNVLFELPTQVKGQAEQTIAFDGFESGDWSGGTGWLQSWVHENRADVTTGNEPHSGKYHVRIRGGNQSDQGRIKRSVNLESYSNASLRVWVKVDGFEAGDQALIKVSPDGTSWTILKTFTQADSDNAYHLYEFNLSTYLPSNEFWVSFESNANQSNDKMFVDDVNISGY